MDRAYGTHSQYAFFSYAYLSSAWPLSTQPCRQPRPGQPTRQPSRPAQPQPPQPQPMNWLDTVESCLQHLDKC
jgi:hypothetical protein